MKYFWHYRPEDNFPPTSVREPSQVLGGEKLNISCTQTELSAGAQRKLVNSWCSTLPELKGVRYLWLSSRVPQNLFDAVCSMPDLERLWIKWSGVKSIEALSLAKGLRCFHLGSSSSLDCIEPLAQLRSLQWLGLENLKRVQNLEALSSMENLEGLHLEGSMWSTQVVDSLKPVGDLSNLRYLSMANLKSKDMTLAPLFPLSRLELFHAAKWWKSEEIKEIYRRNPMLVA